MLAVCCVLLGAAVLALSFCCLDLTRRLRHIETGFRKASEALEDMQHG